jgi:hypothetical protein
VEVSGRVLRRAEVETFAVEVESDRVVTGSANGADWLHHLLPTSWPSHERIALRNFGHGVGI